MEVFLPLGKGAGGIQWAEPLSGWQAGSDAGAIGARDREGLGQVFLK